jgi:hypothetical protein
MLMALLLTLFAGPLLAANGPAGTVQRCDFRAWSLDPDPAGLNVRKGPSPSSAIVGVLPAPLPSRDFDMTPYATQFRVVEARNGWFRITETRRFDERGDSPINLPSGWVSGRYLGFYLQAEVAFTEPRPDAPVAGTVAFGALGRHPSDCHGEWVKVLVAGPTGDNRNGWARGVCGFQDIPCQGTPGDMKPDP